jgi:LmbE family N-acetylglucosaminyl deacetylase
LAEGATSRDRIRNRDGRVNDLNELVQAAYKAGEVLGLSSLHLNQFPDNRMDSVELLDVIKCLEEHFERVCPTIIYTHHLGDLNIDHQITHKAVNTACRPAPHQTVQTLLFFEVPSSTEWQIPDKSAAFAPNWYVDISNILDRKREALFAYSAEMQPWPHARSVEAVEHLARWRGSNIGVEAAEGFMLGRRIT